jgi:hypothetical protein
MALSNAERQKRWREALDALEAQAGIAKNALIDFIIKERQARERELIEAKAEIEHLRKRVAELEERRPSIPHTPDEETLETLREKLQQAEKLLKARNTQIKNLSQRLNSLANNRSPKMSKQLHRQVLSLLHPDRAHGDEAMRERLEKCFQEFSVVKFAFPEDD